MIRARYEDFIDLIRADAAAGIRSASEIGRRIGLASSTVQRFARRGGVDLATAAEAQKAMWQRLKADPVAYEAWRSANSAAQRAVWGKSDLRSASVANGKRGGRPVRMIPVPDWVPGDMRDRYVTRAKQKGEEYAASLARREKREAREAGL